MGDVTTSLDVLAVGSPEFDSSGQQVGWQGSPYWTVGFSDGADSADARAWERLALAVGKASQQFMNIDELGNEVPDEELGMGWPPYLERAEPQVIAPAVQCSVHDGVPGVLVEYLDAHGGWTTSAADARAFERDEHGTHSRTWDVARRLAQSMFDEA